MTADRASLTNIPLDKTRQLLHVYISPGSSTCYVLALKIAHTPLGTVTAQEMVCVR